MEFRKVGGFPVNCHDITFGNDCVDKYGAKWEGGYLVLPNREIYEQVAMHLEGTANVSDLAHSFKLRASTNSSSGFATVKVHEFVVEQPKHYDYLQDLPFDDSLKMLCFYLGIMTHEAAHALSAIALKEEKDNYRQLASNELSSTLDHRYVSSYVDRHADIYDTRPEGIMSEDFAEAVRIFLTNSAYLSRFFPIRYGFIAQRLPYIKENAIPTIVNSEI